MELYQLLVVSVPHSPHVIPAAFASDIFAFL